MREKIALRGEMETLLIPLFSRAHPGPGGLPADPYALEALDQIDYDFTRLRIPKKMRILMALRSEILDDVAREFLIKHPGATVLSLGSGLDARFRRVRGYGQWYDLDFPEVVSLREKLLPAMPGHQNIPSRVTDWEWIDGVPVPDGAVLVIAEGLFMYLTGDEVCEVLRRLSERFRGVAFAFDAYSRLTARRSGAIPSLKKTGAAIRWGMDDPAELERSCGSLRYARSYYLTDPSRLRALDPFYRTAFRAAGAFKAAREAHRVLFYTSG